MRISNSMMFQMLSNGMSDNQSSIYNTEKQIAAGKQLLKASDQPTLWSRLSGLKGRVADLDQFAKNTQRVEMRLSAADQSMDSIGNIIRRASELTVQASDASLSDTDRKALSSQADHLLEQLVHYANNSTEDGFLFGGVRADTAPFELTRNVDGKIDSVTYVGAETTAQVEVAEGDSLPIQVVGGGADGVLMSSSADAFAMMIEMRDRLQAGENLTSSGLQEQFDTSLEQMLVGRASIGAGLEHATLVQSLQANQEAAVREDLDDIEGIDIARAVTELSEKQLAYEASLAMAAKTMRVSLLNHL